ncbi:mitochondrial genome maintenance exonuclease 1, partial [Mobula birostris]|uniref:mitochondrial genome maintenance exonuclease 1 n=1 Tax=Mobula birostris TaxID=1983395 RepID=UPI003B28B362
PQAVGYPRDVGHLEQRHIRCPSNPADQYLLPDLLRCSGNGFLPGPGPALLLVGAGAAALPLYSRANEEDLTGSSQSHWRMNYFGVLSLATCGMARGSLKQYNGALLKELVSLQHSYCTSLCLHCQKKDQNKYEKVDHKKYASLVRSVVSTRVSPQTPETLLGEDALLYGPVIKSKPAREEPAPESLLNLPPFLNGERRCPEREPEAVVQPPLRIPLQRNSTMARLPSVTQILRLTMSLEQAFYLERWRRRMMKELGPDGFKAYTQNILSRGQLFHSALEDALLSSKIPQTSNEDVAGYLQSVKSVLEDVKGTRVLESAVNHLPLHYVGLVDCVAEYRGKLCVIDWKTSEKPKPYFRNTFDNPLQVAAYAGALNHDNNYDFQVEQGLIVVAYKDGRPAHAHFMEPKLLLTCWQRWLLRLQNYQEKIGTPM